MERKAVEQKGRKCVGKKRHIYSEGERGGGKGKDKSNDSETSRMKEKKIKWNRQEETVMLPYQLRKRRRYC